jgi:Na+/melibiose symporter-like transporter
VKSESLYCLISRTEAEYIILFLFFHRNWQEKLELSEKRKVEEAEKLKVKQEFFTTKNDHFKVGVLHIACLKTHVFILASGYFIQSRQQTSQSCQLERRSSTVRNVAVHVERRY